MDICAVDACLVNRRIQALLSMKRQLQTPDYSSVQHGELASELTIDGRVTGAEKKTKSAKYFSGHTLRFTEITS